MGNDNESGSGDRGGAGAIGKKIVGDIFKQAVNMGANAVDKAMDKAEATVNKTMALNPANLSKEMIRDVLENFFENYSIQVNAEIKMVPKKKKEET